MWSGETSVFLSGCLFILIAGVFTESIFTCRDVGSKIFIGGLSWEMTEGAYQSAGLTKLALVDKGFEIVCIFTLY